MAGSLSVEDVPGGRERQRARFGDRRRRAPDVVLVQLQGGSELDQRAGCVPRGGKIVPDLAVAASFPDATSASQHLFEGRANLVGTPFEEVRVQPLEASRAFRLDARRLERAQGGSPRIEGG